MNSLHSVEECVHVQLAAVLFFVRLSLIVEGMESEQQCLVQTWPCQSSRGLMFLKSTSVTRESLTERKRT